MNYSIGDKIRILRSMKGYSQKGLAKTIGLKQENISYLETNRRKKEIKQDILIKIAHAFNMQYKDFENFLSEKNITHNSSETNKEIFSNNLESIIILQKEAIEILRQLNTTR